MKVFKTGTYKELAIFIATHITTLHYRYRSKVYEQYIREDLLCNVIEVLLRTPDKTIDDAKNFLDVAFTNQYYNYKRNNKKYYLNNEINDFLQDSCDITGLKEAPENHVILYNEINKLHKKRKEAVLRRLNDTNPENNTEKANYRHGMLDLKSMLDINDFN